MQIAKERIYFILGVFAASTSLIFALPAYAPTCIELNNCIFTNPFDMATYSYQLLIGDWIYVIFWGSMIGTVFIVSKNPMLAGIVGLIISSFFITGSTFQNTSTSQAFYIGYVLLAISGGGTLFYLIWTKARNP